MEILHQVQNTANDEGFILMFVGIEDEENSSNATDSELIRQHEIEDSEANSQLTPQSQVSRTTSYTTDNDETMIPNQGQLFQLCVEHEN